jgi:hypothetical protein
MPVLAVIARMKLQSEISRRSLATPHMAVILGAGFSHCADLPLQRDLSSELLTPADDPLDHVISGAIREFLKFTFGWAEGNPIPTLEDIFTMIDLSAGTGHALGPQNSPKHLRGLRRLLIYRVFSILDRQYKHSTEIDQLLRKLYEIDHETSFVVLNWDIVLERHLEQQPISRAISYGVNEMEWNGQTERGPFIASIIKVHGSANWVYCDSCRQIFFDRYSKLSLDIKAGISNDDLMLFEPRWQKGHYQLQKASCPRCGCPVGPHVATFSYRKSFRTNAFMASWAAAEEALSQANTWLFVGYSLPAADYEFAHLLKTAELKRAQSNDRPISMHVVLHTDEPAEKRFRQMFGNAIEIIEQGGLKRYLSTGLTTLATSNVRKR